jgi:hypothetical protein
MGLFDRWRKSETASGAEPAAPAPASDYSNLDERVAKLLTDFEQKRFGLSPTGSVDFAACRDAALGLHGQVSDEPSRLALIKFHGALMSSAADGLRREGRDPAELEALWREDYFIMLTAEVVGPDGAVDDAAVERINHREREAGRLGEDEAFNIQTAPAASPRGEDGAPTARFVGERALALWTVVLRAIVPTQREVLLNSFAAEGGRHWITDSEVAFLLDEQPEPHDIVAFGWQAERLAVLLWATGVADLPPGDVKCDPIAFAPLVPPTSQVPFETFLQSLRLRDRWEIDSAASGMNGAYQAAIAAEAEGRPPPEGADPEILGERLRAIAWLLGRQVPEWP